MSEPPNDHPDDDKLRWYGDLSAAEQARIAEHINQCSDCQRKLDANTPAVGRAGEFAPLAPPLPRIPDYEILCDETTGLPIELGRGGMGVVYKARQVRLNRLVALKMILSGHLASAQEVQRFRQEAEHAARLTHPHIVTIHEVGQHEGQHYFSMEYIEGGTLAQRLAVRERGAEGSRKEQRSAAELVAVVARAVHHANQRGILHRDLKPGNILLDRQGQPRVADFGLAKRVEADGAPTLSEGPRGTPCYMAPEQVLGVHPLPLAVDTYGLGALLYELCTGRPPFRGKTLVETMRQVVEEAPERPRAVNPRLNRDLETIALKCLEKDPERRFGSAEALAEDLERWLRGEPIVARPTGRRERLVKWARRRPAVALLGLTVVMALLMVLGGGVAFTVTLKERTDEAEAAVRALKTERQRANGLEVQQLVESARVALRRNQWREALRLYDQVLADPACPERTALEVERVRCLFAYPMRQRLVAELARLAPRTDLTGRLQAEVLLHRGDVVLWEMGPAAQQEGYALIRRALAVPDGLRPADRAYALGIEAEGALQALGHFGEALRHDRFHHRANSAMLMELVLTGQFAAARQQGKFMADLFQEDVTIHVGLAVAALLEEDGPALEVQRDALRRVARDPKHLASMEKAFALLARAVENNRRLHGREKAPKKMPAGPAALHAWGQKAEADLKGTTGGFAVLTQENLPETIGVPLPVLARPVDLYLRLTKGHILMLSQRFADAARIFEEAETRYPESLLRLMHANAHLSLAAQHLGRRDLLSCLWELRRARALAAAAAEAPTVLPFGPYRHNARWFCLFVDGLQEGVRRERGPVALAGCLGLAAPSAGTNLLAATVMLRPWEPRQRDQALLSRLTADSGPFDEARTALLALVLDQLDPEDARTLLADWMKDAPDDPQPARLRASLELRNENLTAALRYAESVLARWPGDAEMIGVRAEALDRLRKLVQGK